MMIRDRAFRFRPIASSPGIACALLVLLLVSVAPAVAKPQAGAPVVSPSRRGGAAAARQAGGPMARQAAGLIVPQAASQATSSLPAPAGKLVLARRFVLDEPYTYTWMKERPRILFGTLLVVTVDRELARPRQVDMPVLYVGTVPAEVTNGHPLSDRRILFVPGEVDLTRMPVFFGSTKLPESVDRAHGLEELRAARAAGIQPFPEQTVATAFSRGGEPLHVRDGKDLYLAIADLIDIYAPAEQDRARGMRAPRVARR